VKSLLRTKPIDQIQQETGLKRCLNAFDLTLLGIGAVIGAGIFVLTGIAAATKAGPAIVLSFTFAGFACAMTALCYAELAAAVGGCGSAYGYAYAGLGEFIAWIIGWNLILEYGVASSAVAIGWSGYVRDMLQASNIYLPYMFTNSPFEGGICNLPAMFIVVLTSLVLIVGVRLSSNVNQMIVSIKLLVIGIFIFFAAKHFNIANWHPFMPFGWSGVSAGAGLIFFAYIGFDAVSTATEETINPQRNVPIAIIASLTICTFLYILVSGLLTGMSSYTLLNFNSPVSGALLAHGEVLAAAAVALGAVAGLTSVILVMSYGLTRILFAMSRDGLLPQRFALLHPHTQTPVRIILITGIFMLLIAGFTPIHIVAEMANIGTLTAFCIVCIGVMVLRYTQPNLERPFKTPFSPWVPLLGAASCFYLIAHLDKLTWLRFVVWSIIGIAIYFWYGMRHSALSQSDQGKLTTI
jgi:APA family basic amino acid/polyamine antiporter